MADLLIHGDAIEVLKTLPDKSVDLILTDPPYGTTACKWDKALDMGLFFGGARRVIKDSGAIILTAQQPFTTDCINAARDIFRYEIIFEKSAPMGFINVNRMPLRAHENIVLFYKALPTYNPQRLRREKPRKVGGGGGAVAILGQTGRVENVSEWHNPRSVVYISTGNHTGLTGHPTQKPVALFEYLIRTYSNEGDTVLDCFAGSGTTAIACINSSRKYILVEKDQKYYEMAKARIEKHQQQLTLLAA